MKSKNFGRGQELLLLILRCLVLVALAFGRGMGAGPSRRRRRGTGRGDAVDAVFSWTFCISSWGPRMERCRAGAGESGRHRDSRQIAAALRSTVQIVGSADLRRIVGPQVAEQSRPGRH